MENLLRLVAISGLAAIAVAILALGMAGNTAELLGPVHFILFLVAVAVYLLPAALAVYRGCDSALWITVVNVLLGWTIFGWFIAIGWAAMGKSRSHAAPASVPPTHAIHGH
jgi:phosphoglycerol transferase MdoB-like AlkP superfamily enzyme